MFEAWKKQILDASSWNQVPGLVGAVRFELRDVAMQWLAWDTFATGDTLFGWVIAQIDIKQFLPNLLRWKKKQIEDAETGVVG